MVGVEEVGVAESGVRGEVEDGGTLLPGSKARGSEETALRGGDACGVGGIDGGGHEQEAQVVLAAVAGDVQEHCLIGGGLLPVVADVALQHAIDLACVPVCGAMAEAVVGVPSQRGAVGLALLSPFPDLAAQALEVEELQPVARTVVGAEVHVAAVVGAAEPLVGLLHGLVEEVAVVQRQDDVAQTRAARSIVLQQQQVEVQRLRDVGEVDGAAGDELGADAAVGVTVAKDHHLHAVFHALHHLGFHTVAVGEAAHIEFRRGGKQQQRQQEEREAAEEEAPCRLPDFEGGGRLRRQLGLRMYVCGAHGFQNWK